MCIFCDIIDNKIPSYKIYEDDEFLAILDIAQTTYGHTLVMPKKHYDTFLDMPSDEFARLMIKVQEISKLIEKNLNVNGMNTLINTNAVAGQSIMHAHAHIIPRYNENDTINIGFIENKFDLNEIKEKITGAIK